MMQRDRDLDRDVAADVELAEKGPDFERRVGEVVPGVRNRPEGPPELADDDLLIERKDLGPDSSTFVAKGDPIPPDLAGLPRRPVREARKK
jgi:hypothetical protein